MFKAIKDLFKKKKKVVAPVKPIKRSIFSEYNALNQEQKYLYHEAKEKHKLNHNASMNFAKDTEAREAYRRKNV